MNWIVYTLKNPRVPDHVRYVGKTLKSPRARLLKHINTAVKARRPIRSQRWILSLVSIGLVPVIEVIESGCGEGYQDAERHWIAYYRALGHDLTNTTDGGEGIVGWGTPEQRRANAKNATAKLTPEQRRVRSEKIRAAFTPEHRKVLAEYQASLTPEERSARSKRALAGLTSEQRRRGALKGWAKMPPEKRRMAGEWLTGWMTPEQRSSNAKKGFARMTPEQRRTYSAPGMRAAAARTPEQHRASGIKAARTRRANLAARSEGQRVGRRADTA
jgi:hypothetical protein